MKFDEHQPNHYERNNAPQGQLLPDNYRQLQNLRRSGLIERFFSATNPSQLQEYEEMVAQLNFFGFFYHEVRLEGSIFLFVQKEGSEFVGLASTRDRIKTSLDHE